MIRSDGACRRRSLPDDPKATLRVDGDEAAKLRAGLTQPQGPACLVVIYGPGLGRRYELGPPLMIGRDPGNRIVVDSADVSRQHALLAPDADGWTISDLGSTNGTHVNDEVIQGEHRLVSGDFIKVSGSIFKYLDGGNVESQFFDAIYRMTIYDGLTQVHNRRYLVEFLEREMARSRRHHRPLCLAMLDIDHFKAINDTYGHLAGDAVLRAIAARVVQMVRREQLFARYGGEEFTLVLPEVDTPSGWIFCERICRAVASEPFQVVGGQIDVTVSIGLADFQPEMSSEAFVQAADEALYRAKRAGRNRVVGREVEAEPA